MKKAKILAVILVMSLMLTGVAYALWNENVTLSTTAAMGDMDLAITCDNHIYPLSFMPGIGLGRTYTQADLEDYMNPLTGSVSADRQSIAVTVGEMYPGAKYGLNYSIKNTGDVPFSLKGVTVTCTNNAELFAKLTGSFQFIYQKANSATGTVISVPVSAMTADGLGAAIKNACKDIVVYPGDELIGYRANQDTVSTFMQVMVDSAITGDEYENQSTSFVVDFNWEQCNPVYFPGV